MSRIKKNILVNEGPDGKDLEQTIDTVTGDVISTIILEPLDEVRSSRNLPTSGSKAPVNSSSRSGLVSAEEMMNRAIKLREETTDKKVHEIVESILTLAEDDLFKGKYIHTLANSETDPTLVKSIVKTLRSLKYTVSKQETKEEGTQIIIKWRTTRKTKQKPSIQSPEPVKEPAKTKKKRGKKAQIRKEVQEDMTFQMGKKA